MRRKKNIKRIIAPDPLYGNILLAQFINHLMWDGKKTVARRVVYDALASLAKKEKKEPAEMVSVFESAIANVSPAVEVKSRRVGGATYQVPREVRGNRRVTLAMRWILQVSRAKKGKPMAERLAEEFALAAKNEGTAIKKKLDTHRMAEANKAFAHFAW